MRERSTSTPGVATAVPPAATRRPPTRPPVPVTCRDAQRPRSLAAVNVGQVMDGVDTLSSAKMATMTTRPGQSATGLARTGEPERDENRDEGRRGIGAGGAADHARRERSSAATGRSEGGAGPSTMSTLAPWCASAGGTPPQSATTTSASKSRPGNTHGGGIVSQRPRAEQWRRTRQIGVSARLGRCRPRLRLDLDHTLVDSPLELRAVGQRWRRSSGRAACPSRRASCAGRAPSCSASAARGAAARAEVPAIPDAHERRAMEASVPCRMRWRR